MKILLQFLLAITLFFAVSISANAQYNWNKQPNGHVKYNENVNRPLSESEMTMLIEVFSTKLDGLVLNNIDFLKDLKHLMRNRIKIFEINDVAKQKKCKLLSEVPLFNDYNKGLKRELSFNIDTFNPLKYKLDFFSNGNYLYRIDRTKYFIQITSQYRR